MPLVLKKSGSHQEAIAAVAVAALEGYRASSAEQEIWDRWMNEGDGGKTVRRANDKDFAKVSQRTDVIATSEVGEAKVLAFLPVAYTEMDSVIRRLQVGNTDFERKEMPEVAGAPTIVLNLDLGMSTGKSAAQAAHALLAWWDLSSRQTRDEWVENGHNINVVEVSGELFRSESSLVDPFAVIHDAGHTEIESGSATAFVVQNGRL
jgi:peptidyl-tRNA hydrolase